MSSGPAIQSADDITLTLTPDEAAQVQQVVDEVKTRLPASLLASPTAMDRFEVLAEIEQAGRFLPRRMVRALSLFRRDGNLHGTLVVRNLPIDGPAVPTPVEGAVHDWSGVSSATVLQLAVVSWIGDVIAYADEKEGRLVQDVVPVRGAEERQENSGSVLLELHTENGFHPFKPDYLTMLCLRPDHDRMALTTSASIQRAQPLMSARALDILRRPDFRIRVSSSFGGGAQVGAAIPALRVPVLSRSRVRPELVADFHAMDPIGPAAAAALAELREALMAVMVGSVLDAGDLMIVDNRVAVHGRTSFRPRYDGSDRWLRRCFAVSDLRASRDGRPPDSHVCRPLREVLLHRRGAHVVSQPGYIEMEDA